MYERQATLKTRHVTQTAKFQRGASFTIFKRQCTSRTSFGTGGYDNIEYRKKRADWRWIRRSTPQM